MPSCCQVTVVQAQGCRAPLVKWLPSLSLCSWGHSQGAQRKAREGKCLLLGSSYRAIPVFQACPNHHHSNWTQTLGWQKELCCLSVTIVAPYSLGEKTELWERRGVAGSYLLGQEDQWEAPAFLAPASCSLHSPSQNSPKIRLYRDHHSGPWSWEMEHINVLSLLIHFTDQEHSPFLANISEPSVLSETPNLCSEEASLRDDPERYLSLWTYMLMLEIISAHAGTEPPSFNFTYMWISHLYMLTSISICVHPTLSLHIPGLSKTLKCCVSDKMCLSLT